VDDQFVSPVVRAMIVADLDESLSASASTQRFYLPTNLSTPSFLPIALVPVDMVPM